MRSFFKKLMLSFTAFAIASCGTVPPARDVVSLSALASPACSFNSPLAAPIENCQPEVLPTTGFPGVDCVRRINQFRCECQHLPPLKWSQEGEVCANQMAQYDSTRTAHAGFRDSICSPGTGASGRAQNECPKWPSTGDTIARCLQSMWSEGPPGTSGEHGHYVSMSSPNYTTVACGFFENGTAGTWAVQNFY
jgi:hypothetical protein